MWGCESVMRLVAMVMMVMGIIGREAMMARCCYSLPWGRLAGPLDPNSEKPHSLLAHEWDPARAALFLFPMFPPDDHQPASWAFRLLSPPFF